jgi:hypothetical protein
VYVCGGLLALRPMPPPLLTLLFDFHSLPPPPHTHPCLFSSRYSSQLSISSAPPPSHTPPGHPVNLFRLPTSSGSPALTPHPLPPRLPIYAGGICVGGGSPHTPSVLFPEIPRRRAFVSSILRRAEGQQGRHPHRLVARSERVGDACASSRSPGRGRRASASGGSPAPAASPKAESMQGSRRRGECSFGCARVDAEPGGPWGEARVKPIYAYKFMRVNDFRIL